MNIMKKYVAVLITVCLSGCSNVDSFNKDIGNMLSINDRTTASTVGGGLVGTATGCAVGVLSGNIARGCLAGAAIGAAGGYAISVSQQLDEAKKLQTEIEQEKTKGMSATIKSSQIETTKDKKLDEMVINIPTDKVYDDSVKRILLKVAKISSASKKNVSINLYGTKKETEYMKNVLSKNISDKVNIYQSVSKDIQIKITPIPDL